MNIKSALKTLGLSVIATTWIIAGGMKAEGQSAMVHSLPSKKLIEFGWDKPTPAYFKEHFSEMEKRPFNGVGIEIPEAVGGGNIFLKSQWGKVSEEGKQKQLDILKSIPVSKSFTDNFIMIHAASDLNWFDEAGWKMAEDQLRFLAKAAKAGHCKGVFWDAESYGGVNPWDFQKQIDRDKHPFTEFATRIRKCGKHFVEVLQEEYPGLTILSMRQLSDFQTGSPFSASMLPIHDLKSAEARLPTEWWGLHIAFTNGILDAIKPDTKFIDANEDAYFYTSPTDFFRFTHTMRQDALALVAPENRVKYLSQYQLGHAVSVEYTQGAWATAISFPNYLRAQALELSTADRLRWFGQNLYYALTTSDEYVWCYSEKMNWWTGENIPAGMEAAILDIRGKLAKGEPLGYNIEPQLLSAQETIKKRDAKIKKSE